ncbi:MAG: hypothetical protein NVS1B14_10920 [Vulcanimicrobiaceae bacterium]
MKYALSTVLLLASLLGAMPAPRAQITSVWMSQNQARPGDVVRGRVETTKSTASIEIRVGGYGTSLTKINDTTFVGAIRIPRIPFFLRRTWTVRVIARTITGEKTDERDTSISIR